MTTLEARIAEVLADHMMRHQGQCVCGWRLTYGPHKLLKTEHEAAREHVAAELAPVIREREAEAWEEGYAKSCFDHGDGGKLHGANNINPYRADNLEKP